MNLKVLKNIGFLLKQQIYIMFLVSSLAFANEKGGVCQSSFNASKDSEVGESSEVRENLSAKEQAFSAVESPKNSELQTATNKTENVSKKSVSADKTSPAQENLASSSVVANTNTKPKSFFRPLYKGRDRDGEIGWEAIPQQDPLIEKNVQESFWNLIHEASKKTHNYDSLKQDLQMLIRNGADIYAKDEKGWTALDHAVNSENSKLVSLIINISKESVGEGYRSFMKSAFGYLSVTEGYSVSDYKRALRIARKNMRTAIENRSEERVTRTLQNGNTIELSHFNRTERETVNTRIIETLKNHLNNERINRWSISLALVAGGMLTFWISSIYYWILF